MSLNLSHYFRNLPYLKDYAFVSPWDKKTYRGWILGQDLRKYHQIDAIHEPSRSSIKNYTQYVSATGAPIPLHGFVLSGTTHRLGHGIIPAIFSPLPTKILEQHMAIIRSKSRLHEMEKIFGLKYVATHEDPRIAQSMFVGNAPYQNGDFQRRIVSAQDFSRSDSLFYTKSILTSENADEFFHSFFGFDAWSAKFISSPEYYLKQPMRYGLRYVGTKAMKEGERLLPTLGLGPFPVETYGTSGYEAQYHIIRAELYFADLKMCFDQKEGKVVFFPREAKESVQIEGIGKVELTDAIVRFDEKGRVHAPPGEEAVIYLNGDFICARNGTIYNPFQRAALLNGESFYADQHDVQTGLKGKLACVARGEVLYGLEDHEMKAVQTLVENDRNVFQESRHTTNTETTTSNRIREAGATAPGAAKIRAHDGAKANTLREAAAFLLSSRPDFRAKIMDELNGHPQEYSAELESVVKYLKQYCYWMFLKDGETTQDTVIWTGVLSNGQTVAILIKS